MFFRVISCVLGSKVGKCPENSLETKMVYNLCEHIVQYAHADLIGHLQVFVCVVFIQ